MRDGRGGLARQRVLWELCVEAASCELLEIKFVKMAMANSIFINCKSRRVHSNPTPAAATPAHHAASYLQPTFIIASSPASFTRLSRVRRIMLIVCTSLGTHARRQQSLLCRGWGGGRGRPRHPPAGSASPLIGFGNIIIRKYKLFVQKQEHTQRAARGRG